MRTACAPDTARSHIRLLTDGAVCDNCRPRINELYQKQVRVLFYLLFGEYYLPIYDYRTVGNFNLRNSGKVRKTVDAMSTMSRVSSSGKNEPSFRKTGGMTAGFFFQDVLCTSKDCPIFYRRKKAQKDVEDSAAMLERFDNELW